MSETRGREEGEKGREAEDDHERCESERGGVEDDQALGFLRGILVFWSS